MIPSISISIPPSVREAAKQTTEEVMKALDSKMRAFQSLYSQVSCSDMSAMNRISDVCAPLSGNGGGGDAKLDWRADPFRSASDLTLNVYDWSRDDGQPTPYYAHLLLLAHGGRQSGSGGGGGAAATATATATAVAARVSAGGHTTKCCIGRTATSAATAAS
jgi:hypothetical protein